MIYSLDTANLEMIKKTRGKYPLGAYSMNPSIAVKDLTGSTKTFFEDVMEMREVIGEDAELWVQVIGEKAEDMVKDAHTLLERIPGNTCIKIPACPEGYKAMQILSKEGVTICCTAVFDVNQALLAVEAGAANVAVYVNRLDCAGGDGIEVIRKIVKIFRERNIKFTVSAASVKNPLYIEEAALAGADYVAVGYDLLEQLATHSMTEKTLEKFKEDWEGLYGKGTMIHNMR